MGNILTTVTRPNEETIFFVALLCRSPTLALRSKVDRSRNIIRSFRNIREHHFFRLRVVGMPTNVLAPVTVHDGIAADVPRIVREPVVRSKIGSKRLDYGHAG